MGWWWDQLSVTDESWKPRLAIMADVLMRGRRPPLHRGQSGWCRREKTQLFHWLKIISVDQRLKRRNDALRLQLQKYMLNNAVKSATGAHKWVLIQLWLIFATKSGRSSQTLPPVSSLSHHRARSQPVALRKITEPIRQTRPLGQKQDNVIVVMMLTHPSWCSAAHGHQNTRTRAHTHTTVLHLVSWLHPVKNNDKYVKTVTKARRRLESLTWSETWPDVLMR